MPRKQSEILSEEMEILRAEIQTITEKDDATDDEVARADTLLDEWQAKDAIRTKALEREAQVEQVMRASLNAGNRESGDGAGRKSPEYMKRTVAYDQDSYNELARSLTGSRSFNGQDAISRSKTAVEGFGNMVPDNAKQDIINRLDGGGEYAEKLARHILLASSPEYREQFEEIVRNPSGFPGELVRTAMSLTSGNGGYLVPVQLDPTIVLTNNGALNPFRSIATVKSIVGANVYNGVTSAGVSAEWTAEGSQAADASPTFGQISITCHKADAYLFGSYEMLSDSGFAAELSILFSDAKNRLEADAFATANTGATIPRGVLAAVAAVTASIVTAATTGALVAGDVFNTYDALTPRSAANAAWLANPKIYSKVRQLSTNQGANFWTTIGGGLPSELIGAPVYQASSMTGTVGNGNNVLLAGDFSKYYIVDRVGFSVKYVDVVVGANQRPTGQAGWYGYWRVGADVADANAFRLLQLNQVAAATALA